MIEISKYTPGPWIVSDIYPADVYAKDSTTGRGRCVSTGVDIRGGNVCNTAEDRANAALIAAAPELLAALERVLVCHRLKISLDTNAGAVEQARAAIAKAKGE